VSRQERPLGAGAADADELPCQSIAVGLKDVFFFEKKKKKRIHYSIPFLLN